MLASFKVAVLGRWPCMWRVDFRSAKRIRFFWPSRPLIVCIRHNVNTWFRKRSSSWRCLQNSQMTISKEVCHFYQVAQFWSLWDKTWTRRSQKRANSNTRFKVPDWPFLTKFVILTKSPSLFLYNIKVWHVVEKVKLFPIRYSKFHIYHF